MAIAIANATPVINVPGLKAARVQITLDTSYPTGGSTGVTAAIEAALANIAPEIQSVLAIIVLQSQGYDFDYLPAPTDTLKVWGTGSGNQARGSEVANGTNLSAITILALVLYQ